MLISNPPASIPIQTVKSFYMSVNEGNENAKELMDRVCKKFEKEIGRTIAWDWKPKTYDDLRDRLNNVLKGLPKERLGPVTRYGKIEEITSDQLKYAIKGKTNNLKDYLRLAIDEYLRQTTAEPSSETKMGTQLQRNDILTHLTDTPVVITFDPASNITEAGPISTTKAHTEQIADGIEIEPAPLPTSVIGLDGNITLPQHLDDLPDPTQPLPDNTQRPGVDIKDFINEIAGNVQRHPANTTNSRTVGAQEQQEKHEEGEREADKAKSAQESEPQQGTAVKPEPQNGPTGSVSLGERLNLPIDDDKRSANEYKIVNENIGILAFIVASTLGIVLVFIYSSAILTGILNIIVLFSFFAVIQTKKLVFRKQRDIKMLARDLNITEGAAQFNIVRVNKTIIQLCENIRWFIIFLLVFYFLNFLEDKNPNQILNRYDPHLLIIDYIENLFNIVSAAFIYFGFKVLYDKSLDEENNPQSYFMGTLLLLLMFIISYSFFLFLGIGSPVSQRNVTNYYSLACGIYNGLAMFLMFSRLISMEYFFKDIKPSNKAFPKDFFHYGAIFILPVYALVNCLYGVQEFTESFPHLKTIIFLVCFMGKGFFLLFIYHYINFRWLHIYIHMILAKKQIPTNILGRINAVEDDEE